MTPGSSAFPRLSLLILLTLISGCAITDILSGEEITAKPKMESLVSSQWLNEHISDPDLVVLDSTVIVTMDNGKMSSVSGKPRYDEGHIPNAGFADLKGAMSSDDIELDFIMPTPEQFAQAIGELGVDNNSRVVVYSTDSHVWATRLWWMLRWVGLEQVAVLDGGFASWEREGRAISTEPSNHTPKKFKLALNPGLISDREEVFNAIYDDKVNIIDTLPPASYNGEFTMYARPGHIVSAINMPASDLINESGYYKSYDELDMRQEGDRSQRTITYCGAGITATGTAFILQRLGFTDVAVYMGSLQEWAPDAENPMTIEGVPNR